MFSNRTARRRDPSRFAAAVERQRERGLIDLTTSNPTKTGLSSPMPAFDPGGPYEPAPLGSPEAREAIAKYYVERGCRVAAEQIVVCATTSEAYTWLFTMLADPGETIDVPSPSYPLIGLLADHAGVRAEPYALPFDGHRFSTPTAPLEGRARVVVSPNNPTGNRLTEAERAALGATGVPLILDEVFLDSLDEPRSFAGRGDVLSFTLSGVSKVLGWPGAKLSWIVVGGPAAAMDEALGRLEMISDTFLSASQGVQTALPDHLPNAGAFAARVRERTSANRAQIADVFGDVVEADGGWCAIVRTDAPDDEALALELLEAGVLVQPGFLFDLPFEGGLVISTIVAPEVLEAGLERIIRLRTPIRRG